MAEKLNGIHSIGEYAKVLQEDFGWDVEIERKEGKAVLICLENNTECL